MNNLDAVFVNFYQTFLSAWKKHLIFPVSNKKQAFSPLS
ncbi:hypothetical protein BTN49_2747 [Candidatus Enterovibrio escicola]|uniref:Mobile element protein n=1 Tax=Candidatus Enterovibrio escicola TaxID=1927127 RepID=A0A2A5T0P7_9GAMM|nr:hypothetical protein BTN49_2747 [Candidatus Enterovibrio escacola]